MSYFVYKVTAQGYIPKGTLHTEDSARNFSNAEWRAIKFLMNGSVYYYFQTLNDYPSIENIQDIFDVSDFSSVVPLLNENRELIDIVSDSPWSSADTIIFQPRDSDLPTYVYKDYKIIMHPHEKYDNSSFIRSNTPFSIVIKRLNLLRHIDDEPIFENFPAQLMVDFQKPEYDFTLNQVEQIWNILTPEQKDLYIEHEKMNQNIIQEPSQKRQR